MYADWLDENNGDEELADCGRGPDPTPDKDYSVKDRKLDNKLTDIQRTELFNAASYLVPILSWKHRCKHFDYRDAAQSCYLELWKAARKFDDMDGDYIGKFRAYATTTIRNTMFVFHRHNSKSMLRWLSEVNESDMKLSGIKDEGMSFLARSKDDHQKVVDVNDELLFLLRRLHPQERDVLVMRYVQGKGYKDIGEQLGCKHAKAKQIHDKAMKRFLKEKRTKGYE